MKSIAGICMLFARLVEQDDRADIKKKTKALWALARLNDNESHPDVLFLRQRLVNNAIERVSAVDTKLGERLSNGLLRLTNEDLKKINATASKLSDVAHRELITTEKASLNLNRHTHAVGEQLFRGLPTIDEDKVDALLENFSSVAPVHGGIDATADALLEEAQKQFDEKNNL